MALPRNFHICVVIFTFILLASAAKKPWESYIYSPASRTVSPVAVHSQSGNVSTSTKPKGTYQLAPGSRISLDFGVEVGGWVSFRATTANSVNNSSPQLSLAFAESPDFVRAISDDTGATPTQDWDQALNVTLPDSPTFYTTPKEKFRGGFRFLTINALAQVDVSNITCTIGFAPNTPDLRKYGGHFYTPDDELLVKVWYAGAYTVQTNIAPKDTGRWLPQVRPGWAYNNTIGVSGPILVDGAKRDRAIWPGDLGIQGTTAFLALGADGLESVFHALETLFYYQNSTTGRFPFAGPATGSFRNGAESDTYHAWSLIAMHNYAIWTADTHWVTTHWNNMTRGIDLILAGLDNPIGLHEQTRPNDWARQGGGGYNSALNALDYHVLTSFASLARALVTEPGQTAHLASTLTSQAHLWSNAATRLKKAYNTHLWHPSQALYTDNQTTPLTPQDGNALALLYSLPHTPSQTTRLSTALKKFHTPLGPQPPELPNTISPFISSIELLAHFRAHNPHTALSLLRTLWTHLLTHPSMTGSTFAEGLSGNGSLAYRADAGYKKDAAYTSLSHGWSSGPTVALSGKVGGLEVVGWKRWGFGPASDGSVRSVDVGFQTPEGGFGVRWEIVREGGNGMGNGNRKGRFGFQAVLETPRGWVGSVEVPWRCEWVGVGGKRYGGGEVEGGGRVRVEARGCVWGEEE